MNVLIIHNTYQQPGGEDVVVEQEKRLLVQHGHRVNVYLRSNYEIESLSFSQKLRIVGRITSADDSKTAVRTLIRDFKPDVVHVHNTFLMVSPSVYEACSEEGIPVVQTLHNYRLLCPAATFYRDGKVCNRCVTHGLQSSVQYGCYRDSRMMSGAIALMLQTHRARQTWSKVDAYIALSSFLKDTFVQSGFAANKIYVKPNFVAPDPGERQQPGDYALYVGRLSPEKGVATLIKAWTLMPRQVPLVIAGDGPMRASLEADVVSKGLHSIRFAGQLKREKVYEQIKNAAFVIVPSIWEEPFGLIIAEAFACGTPVLGAAVGAIQEMIENGVTGLPFAPNNPEDLANKASWAWSHQQDLAEMGKAARRVFETRYTASANYQRLMEIYAFAIDAHFRSKRKHALRAAS